jgi:putative DNA primase/helicase
MQIDTLMVRHQENNNSQADLADLCGARFVMTSETEEGQCLAEGKLKRITQGVGKIRGCRKYQNPFDFNEIHKLWIDANYLPIVRGTDQAIWNRLHSIPFTVTIQEARQRQLKRNQPNARSGLDQDGIVGQPSGFRKS